MDFTLSGDPPVRYSNQERVIFDALPKDGSRISSLELIGRVYKRGQTPFHARTIVVGCARSLLKKIEHNKEPFRLAKTKPAGPTPVQFWLEPRDDRRTR